MSEKDKNKSEKKNVVTKATKKPASFSESKPVKKSEKTTDKKIDKKPEKKIDSEKKIEKKVEEPAKVDSIVAEFETLKIKPEEKKAESKIVIRDVAKEDKEVEKKAKKVSIVIPEKPLARTIERTVEKPAAKPALKSAEKSTKKPDIKPVSKPAGKLTAKEIKEREIEKAIKTARKLPDVSKPRRRSSRVYEFGWTRVVLSVACAVTAVFAIVYFVNLTSADMSLKVAAMQSGIEASYPSYVPRGYNLSDVTSSAGKVTMNFKTDDSAFMISEENTTWDSNALLNNYVKVNYENNYTVVKEQGLTLYMGDDWEVWVNGGMLYKLKVSAGTLTKKQMKTIATSL